MNTLKNLIPSGVIVASLMVVYGLTGLPVLAISPTPNLSIVPVTASMSGTPAVATSSAQASESAELKKLRDRLANVVSEMRKKEQKVVAGDLKSMNGSVLEVETVFGNTEKAQIDDTLTKFYRIIGAATEEIKRADVKNGQYVIVTGPHLDGVISANEVYVDEHFESRAGRITEVNSANFTFKVDTFEKETLTVSVDRGAAQEIMNSKTKRAEAGGFSRIKEGDIAHIVYSVTSLKDTRTTVTPNRIFVIPGAYFAQ